VALLGEPDSAPPVAAGADGGYTVTSTQIGLVTLRFTGVDHEPETVLLFLGRAGREVRVDVRLAVLPYSDDLSQAAVIGDFNGFRNDDSALPMAPIGGGRFSAQLGAIPASTIGYQLVNVTQPVETINSTHPGPPIAGTAADSYVLHDDGRYASLVKTSAAGTTIVFDPSLLPRSTAESVVTIRGGNRETDLFAALTRAMHHEVQEYTGRRLDLKRRGAADEEVLAFVRQYDWVRFHGPIREALDGAGSALFKQAAMVLYLGEVGGLAEMSHSPLDRAVARRALAEVPPTSSLWATVPDAFHTLTWGNFHTAIDGYEAYFDRISTTHPNPELREAILSYAFSVASYAGDRERMARIYERLVGDFPDSQAVAVARKQVGPDRRVRVGAPVPDFRVVALDDPATVYTRTEMLGRIYLIDFWGTWCGPCRAEMPHLHKAFERYRARGFTILSLSCDESANAVRQFRRDRWPMPWRHGFLERCYRARDRNDLVTGFEVTGFPAAVLVGADGTILEVGSPLRGERLAATLDRVFASRPATDGS
jgi:thiol-disulfide isomerase/thioredoxin